MDETSSKILNSTMLLVMEKGYSSMTTKDIAKRAGVNESTIFRKFQGKKDIVVQAMKLPEWHPDLKLEDFEHCNWKLKEDLLQFASIYMKKVTPNFVKISIGLRSPELFDETAKGIMQVPAIFKQGLLQYFEAMVKQGKLAKESDTENLAMIFLSMNFGFVFLRASFGDQLSNVAEKDYIKKSVEVFVNGIEKI